MATTEITLDKSDPAINDLIGGWQDGETYTISLKQVSTEGTKVTFQATDQSEEEQAEQDDDISENTKTPPPPAKSGPGMHKPALMVLIGNHGKGE